MTVLFCNNCGMLTNTACAHTKIVSKNKLEIEYCYASRNDEKWVKGCGFDHPGDDFTKAYAMSLITGKHVNTFLRKKK